MAKPERASSEFIAELDSMEVIASTVKDALALEEDSAKQLLRVFKDSRRELLDRLMAARISEFQSRHIHGVLAQVESVINALTDDMETVIDVAAGKDSKAGVSDTIAQLMALQQKFSGQALKININQVLVANETKGLLMQRYQSSIDTYGRELINRIQNQLVQALVQKRQYSEVVQAVAGASGLVDGELWRVQRIVRTELHNVYDTTKFRTLQEIQDQELPDLKKMSFDPLDHRTGEDSKLVAGQIQPIDEPFRYTLNGKDYEFMNHPNRPNDRGMTMPYRDGWERQSAELVSSMYPEA